MFTVLQLVLLYACFSMLTAWVFLFCIFFFVYAAIEIFSMNKVD